MAIKGFNSLVRINVSTPKKKSENSEGLRRALKQLKHGKVPRSAAIGDFAKLADYPDLTLERIVMAFRWGGTVQQVKEAARDVLRAHAGKTDWNRAGVLIERECQKKSRNVPVHVVREVLGLVELQQAAE